MKNLFKCEICGFIAEGENAPAICPKCGFGAEKFEKLDEETTAKIYRADKTNTYLAEMIALADKMIKLATNGVEDNLDPTCLGLFQKALDESWMIKQRAKAEVEKHVRASKW